MVWRHETSSEMSYQDSTSRKPQHDPTSTSKLPGEESSRRKRRSSTPKFREPRARTYIGVTIVLMTVPWLMLYFYNFLHVIVARSEVWMNLFGNPTLAVHSPRWHTTEAGAYGSDARPDKQTTRRWIILYVELLLRSNNLAILGNLRVRELIGSPTGTQTCSSKISDEHQFSPTSKLPIICQ